MNNSLFGAAGLFALATGFKLIAGVAIVKTTAAALGPEGYGYLGQLTTLVIIVTMLAGGGIHIGLTKFSAQPNNDEATYLRYLIAAFKIWLAASILLGIALLILNQHLSIYLFKDTSYSWTIFALAAIQPLIGLNNISQAILSGKRDIQGTALITVIGACISAGLIIPLSLAYGLGGAMLATIIAPGTTILVSLSRLRSKIDLQNPSFEALFSNRSTRTESRRLLKFTVMLLVSAITMPAALMLIRANIADHSDWTNVGIWQGMIRLSDVYLQFVTVLFGQYYLPRLSGTKDQGEFRKEVETLLAAVIPFMFLICTILYLTKGLVISTLFSDQFSAMEELFAWQLVGDFLKVASYVFAYIAVAFALTKIYILAEVTQALLLIIFSSYLIPEHGLIGAVQAHCATYFLYFLLCSATYIGVLKKGLLFR